MIKDDEVRIGTGTVDSVYADPGTASQRMSQTAT